jgi:hypothetical protein
MSCLAEKVCRVSGRSSKARLPKAFCKMLVVICCWTTSAVQGRYEHFRDSVDVESLPNVLPGTVGIRNLLRARVNFLIANCEIHCLALIVRESHNDIHVGPWHPMGATPNRHSNVI